MPLRTIFTPRDLIHSGFPVVLVLLPLVCLLLWSRGAGAADAGGEKAGEKTCRELLAEAEASVEKGILHYEEGVGLLGKARSAAQAEKDRACLHQVQFSLARLYLSGNNYRDALDLLKRLQKGNRSAQRSAVINNMVGIAFYYEEMYSEAAIYFKRAIAIDPAMKVALFNLKSINRRLLHLNTARAYQKAKDYERALAEYESLLWVSPNFVNGRYRLGLLLKDMGRLDEAIKELKRAYNINPKHRQAHLVLKSIGDVHAAKGDSVSAVEYYREALRLEPEYAEARQALIANGVSP